MLDTMNRKKKLSLFWGGAGLLGLLGIDQLTKYLACEIIKTNGPFVLIPGFFELCYLENQGAAFGMMKNMQWIFILFALFISAVLIRIYLRMPVNQRLKPLRIICVILTAGAAGNMIDRILHQYVIDFLYLSCINFPIFNVADIYVCAATAVFLVLLLFYYKEEDLERILGKTVHEEYVSEIIEKVKESRKE